MGLGETWVWNWVKGRKAQGKKPSHSAGTDGDRDKMVLELAIPSPNIWFLIVEGVLAPLVPKEEALFLEAQPRICLLGPLSDFLKK